MRGKQLLIFSGIILLLVSFVVVAQSPENIRTATTLRSNHTRFTEPGDVITLSGEIVPTPTSSSGSVPLLLRVDNPDGTYAFNDVIYTNESGNYQLSVPITQRGYMRAEIKFFGDSYYRSSGSEIIIPILPEIGVAIVVAGGGYQNSMFPSIQYLSDMAVLTFRRLYIPDESTGDAYNERNRIWYLHPDLNYDILGNDGVDGPDVDGVPTLANLQWAIESWAEGLIQTKDDSGNWWPEGVMETPLTVYLIGDFLWRYTEPDEFYINENETLTGVMLNEYLDNLESAVKQKFIDAGVTPPSYLPVNVVVEGESSGSFIEPISQWGRVILTSTEDEAPSYLASDGSVSFSYYFLSRIAGKQYIHPSFAYAQLNILGNPALEGQIPQLEATGPYNGVVRTNEISDEITTASLPLEYRPIANARPRMYNAYGQITLHDTSEALLWVYVDDHPDNRLEVVEAVVIPPNGSSEEAHILTMTRNYSVSDRWEGAYDNFFGEGTYTIIYTARGEAGNMESFAFPTVEKHIFVEDTQPPENVTGLQVIDVFDDTVELLWASSESPDTQGYKIYFTPPGGIETLWGDAGNVHQVKVTGLDIFGNQGLYNFRVTAYDRVPLESAGVNVEYISQNQPPIANDQSLTTNEDEPLAITLTATDPENDELTFVIMTWPTSGTISGTAPNLTYTPNDNFHGTDPFTFMVNDGMADSEVAAVNIIINPVDDPPIANDQWVNTDEDTELSIILTASDVENDPLSFSVINNPNNGVLNGTAPNLTYTSEVNYNGTDSFTFIANDGEIDSQLATINITINPVNDPPLANAGGPYSGDEGSAINLTGGNSYDSDGAIVLFEWDWENDGVYDVHMAAPTILHTWVDDYNGVVSLMVTDDGGAPALDDAQVIINNVPPSLSEIIAPVDPISVGTEINTSARFNDPGVLDTHTATWDWGDGSTSESTVDESAGSGTAYGIHVYSIPGVYTIKLTLSDDDDGQASIVYEYVVVYDPAEGFVTGGGWINSPEGAYTLDPTLTGKATFGFVAKYKKGANTPSGNTEFQFKAGDLNFHSDSYDWLVISGAKAKFKGTGTINGSGNYGFMLSAIDDKLTPSTDVDLFRIKIWDKNNNDAIVYDNQIGKGDDADPSTIVEGGSIVIHKK